MAANVYDTVLLTGDSITEGGWAPGGLAQRLAGEFPRISRVASLDVRWVGADVGFGRLVGRVLWEAV